ncbi:MAG: monooxygenase [Burkholderiales bacterium 66-5]|nr:MAG: monooxygenase [Burkholderiales bacterium 66-5]
MAVVLQVDFTMDGPFGTALSTAFEGLARSISNEPGFLWKIWTENAQDKQAGGIYLFDTRAHAQQYLDMHSQRLTQAGVRDIRARIFDVNEALTGINKGPVG